MRKAILVAGLAYGDEGKGATVDFLCRRLPVDLVVRYNGGSQAAHNVVTPHGQHHTFSQFGSGSFTGDHVRTHLSRFMLVDPLTMMNEAEALCAKGVRPWRSLTVDPRCVIITPYHKLLNREREKARGDARHGSCGMGVGVAREWQLKYGDAVLRAGDLGDYNLTLLKLNFQRNLVAYEVGIVAVSAIDDVDLAIDLHRWYERVVLSEFLPKSDLMVFEGAQGVLLDETHGIEPHRTWTDCTFANADTLLNETGVVQEDRLRVGCLRTYLTRHGAGPLESSAVDYAQHWEVPEAHNEANEWQGPFRTAAMNFDLVRKSIHYVGGVDTVALSHLDACGFDSAQVVQEFERQLKVPVGICANGPSQRWFRDTSSMAKVLNCWGTTV